MGKDSSATKFAEQFRRQPLEKYRVPVRMPSEPVKDWWNEPYRNVGNDYK